MAFTVTYRSIDEGPYPEEEFDDEASYKILEGGALQITFGEKVRTLGPTTWHSIDEARTPTYVRRPR